MIVDEMQISFMSVREAIDALFVLIRMREAYHAKGKSFICVLWTKRKLLTEHRGKCRNWK